MGAKLYTLNKRKKTAPKTKTATKPLEQHAVTCIIYFSHTCSQAVLVYPSWGAAVGGGGGWCRGGQSPAASSLPPRGGLSAFLSLSPAWSFIIYRRDKIKQTQQNGVKSEGLRLSHSHTLIHGAGSWRCTEFVQVLVPASQHPSASRSQVETLC